MNRPTRLSTAGNYCNLRTRGLLSSKLSLQYTIFVIILVLTYAGSSSSLKDLNIVVMGFRHRGQSIFYSLLQQIVKMHSQQNECPHVDETSNFFGSTMQIGHCPYPKAGFLLIGPSLNCSSPKMNRRTFLNQPKIYPRQLQTDSPKITNKGSRTVQTQEPTASIIWGSWSLAIQTIIYGKKYKNSAVAFIDFRLASEKSILIFHFFEALLNSMGFLFIQNFVPLNHIQNFLVFLFQFPLQRSYLLIQLRLLRIIFYLSLWKLQKAMQRSLCFFMFNFCKLSDFGLASLQF